jgi:Secretion system C-terminal sorting domain
MMKRQLLIASALISSGGAIAQPTLTETTNGLVPIVDSYGITSFTTNVPADFYGPSEDGADATYGFFMLEETGGNDRFLVSPSVSASSSVFPTATVLMTNGGSDTMAYKVDANGIELVGLRTSFEGTVAFSNSAKELVFPCTFGTTWNDTYALNYTASGFPVVRTGTINGVADGYGELQLPNAIVPNVLRVKVRKTQQDQAAITSVYRSFDSYYYYSTDSRYPMLKLSRDTVILGGGSPAVTFVAEWLLGPGTGINDVDAASVSFEPYPNPTTGRVDLGLGQDELRSVEVFTAAGRLVRSEVKTIGSTANTVLDLTGLATGVYHLKVTGTDGRSGSRRIVVQ